MIHIKSDISRFSGFRGEDVSKGGRSFSSVKA